MKRKLICILFILAGIATIVGTILLSLGAFEDADRSPAWTLIYLSIVTIAAAVRIVNRELASGLEKVFLWVLYIVSGLAILAGLAFMFYADLTYTLIFIIIAITIAACFRYVNSEPEELEVTKRGMVFLRVFRAISIMAILVCAVFIVLLLYTVSYYPDWTQNVLTILALAVLGIVGAALSLKFRAPVFGRGINRAARCVPLAVALVAITALCIFSISFINTLMFIIFVAITIAVWLRYDNDEPDETDETEVTRHGMVFLRAFHAVGILIILACFGVIVIMFFITRNDYGPFRAFHNVRLLMTLAGAGIAAAALSLKQRAPVSARGNARVVRCVPVTVAVAIIFVLGSVYLNCMPKYSIDDGLNIVLSDEELAQKDIAGFYETTPSYFFEDALFAGNPFYTNLFSYQCDSFGYDAGLHIEKGFILFNPATGEYEYMRTKGQDKTYSVGDWPELTGNFMQDKDGQHNAVLNLYYRDLWYMGVWGWQPEGSEMNRAFSVDSSEWDATLKDVMYPHSFPENEARAFLRSMGEETLKTKLLEQIDLLDSKYTDKTIDLFFFGIDIGTYQNGEIILK